MVWNEKVVVCIGEQAQAQHLQWWLLVGCKVGEVVSAEVDP